MVVHFPTQPNTTTGITVFQHSTATLVVLIRLKLVAVAISICHHLIPDKDNECVTDSNSSYNYHLYNYHLKIITVYA